MLSCKVHTINITCFLSFVLRRKPTYDAVIFLGVRMISTFYNQNLILVAWNQFWLVACHFHYFHLRNFESETTLRLFVWCFILSMYLLNKNFLLLWNISNEKYKNRVVTEPLKPGNVRDLKFDKNVRKET